MLGALMQKRAPEKIMASPFKLNNNLKNRYFTYVSVGPMVMYGIGDLKNCSQV